MAWGGYKNVKLKFLSDDCVTAVCDVCSKDVRLPQQLQRAMAAEAEAARDARAKVSHVIQTTAERPRTLDLKLGRVCTTSRLSHVLCPFTI